MTKDVLTTAREREFGAFLVALESAGLRAELESKGPFTVFIPIDAAYERFTTNELDELDGDPDALRRLMRYAIVRGALTRDALSRLDSVETLGGEALEITSSDGLEVDGIAILEADVECSNGVAHILAAAPIPPSLRGIVGDEMLTPPKKSTETAETAENVPSAETASTAVSAQTAESIENDVLNYETTAETARPRDPDRPSRIFAEDIEKTEKDAETLAADLRAVEEAAEREATQAETLARGLEAFERKLDEPAAPCERAETSEKTNRNDFYGDLDSQLAENADTCARDAEREKDAASV